MKKRIFFLSIYILTSVYLFEAYLTFTSTSKNLSLDNYIDNETQLVINPSHYLNKDNKILPFSGISNARTIYCNENGYYSIYKSDRFGFNNPDEEWDKKEIEYLLIGDSFTHGACVNRPNDIASVLRILSKKTAINLGYAGNGPLLEYGTLKEYLNSNVKNIVWLYLEGDDLKNLKNEVNDQLLIKYLNNSSFSQNLKLRQNEINLLINEKVEKNLSNDLIQIKKNRQIKYKILKFIRLNETKKIIFQKDLKIKDNQFEDIIFITFKEILNSAKNIAIKNNSKLYFIYLPEFNRYKNNYINNNYHLIRKIVNDLEIPFIDIDKEVFKKEKNPLKFFPDRKAGHYNEKGYYSIGKKIHNLVQN